MSASAQTYSPVISGFSPTNGGPGTSVTINGAYLNNVVSVQFNTAKAVISSATASRIVVTVPADATTGTIAVFTATDFAESSGIFTVAPRVSDFQPAMAAPGAQVLIEGANFAKATAVKFNGVAASFVVTADTQIQAIVPASALSGPVSVTTAAGSGQSTNAFIVIGAGPYVSGFSPTNGPVGATVIISGAGFTQA